MQKSQKVLPQDPALPGVTSVKQALNEKLKTVQDQLTCQNVNLKYDERDKETGYEESLEIIFTEKLALCRTDGRLLLRAKFFQVQSHGTQRLGQIGLSKIWPDQI